MFFLAKIFSRLQRFLLFFLAIIVAISAILFFGLKNESGFWGKFVADVISPVGARNYMYRHSVSVIEDSVQFHQIKSDTSSASEQPATGAETTLHKATTIIPSKTTDAARIQQEGGAEKNGSSQISSGKNKKKGTNNNADDNDHWSVFAYLLGLLFFSGFLIPLVTNLFRNMADNYNNGTLLSYSWKNHILFIGYDKRMIGTLKEACDKSSRVVVAVPNDVPSVRLQIANILNKSRQKKIEVVQCAPNDWVALKKRGCIRTAKLIYLIGQPDDPSHDALNMLIMGNIVNWWFRNKVNVNNKRILIFLRNNSTISMLKRFDFEPDTIWDSVGIEVDDTKRQEINTYLKTNCEFFNFCQDRALQLLTDDNFRFDWQKNDPKRQAHLVIIGMSDMGVAIVREVLRLAHPSGLGTKFLITMTDDNAYREMNYFVGRTKELFKYCRYSFRDYDNPQLNFDRTPSNDIVDVEFEFVQCDVANPKFIDYLYRCSQDKNQLLKLVVCTPDSPRNMAVAMYLPPQMLNGENAVPTWVFQDGDGNATILGQKDFFPTLRTFGFRDCAVMDSATSPAYRFAEKIAFEYERQYGDDTDGSKKKEWKDLPATHRWSSFYTVMSNRIKFNLPKAFDLEVVEHNRWTVEKLSAGFIPTDEKQHQEVTDELEKLEESYPDWRISESSRKKIEDGRTKFKALKNAESVKGIRIHDDIRPYDDLDDYTKFKDEFIHLAYKKIMQKEGLL